MQAATPQSLTPPSIPGTRLGAWITLLAAVTCFLNALPNDFCLDGVPVVRNNPLVTQPGQWQRIWTVDMWGADADAPARRDLLYRPVSLVSYRLLFQIFGDTAWPQLLVNLLLHAAASLLVFAAALRLRCTSGAALVAGVFFAVMPIHTDVVPNVVGRADLLATVCLLGTLLLHERALTATTTAQRALWRILAALTAFAAMGAKESGAAVLPAVVLWDAFYQLRSPGGSLRMWVSSSTLIRLSYLLLPLAVYLVLRYEAFGGTLTQNPALTKAINPLVDAPPWQRALGAFQIWGMYWAKTFYPRILCIEYSINAVQLTTGVLNGHVLLGMFVMAALTVWSVMAWRRSRPQVAILVLLLAACYLPTSNTFVLMWTFFAERTWYLPSAWVAILTATALIPFLQRRIAWWSLAIVAALMTMRCWIRNAEWRNNTVLYAAAYRDHPESAHALFLYGGELVRLGHVEDGIELLVRSLHIDSGYVDARRALGAALLTLGRMDEALHELRIADMQEPGHAPTRNRLLQARQAVLEAHADDLAEWQRTAHDEGTLQAHLVCAYRMLELGFHEQAAAFLAQHESRFGDDSQWQAVWAEAMLFGGDLDGGIDRFRRAQLLDTQNPHLAVQLAMLLLERRKNSDIDEAEHLARTAAALAPGDPRVLVCQAELAAYRGRIAEALDLYRRALARTARDGAEYQMWVQRYRTLGG